MSAFKFKTVGSPPTRAQRVLNETLWNPAFFCCWKIEAAQGWDGRVSAAAAIVAKCRRLGGSRISGFEPLVSNHSLGVTSERDLLAFQPCRFSGFLDLLLLLSEEKAGMRSGLALSTMQ
ncbi:hypothetical protein A8A01_21340 [Ewingella americana]|nr:hypothetical protein A8A01_21340 [Ewingella americana]